MTSRERMLCALNNGRPDRLPCQVHGWMDYYLKTYLNGMDWWQAYEKFDMDFAIYVSPKYVYSERELSNWNVETRDMGKDAQGNALTLTKIKTPEGELRQVQAANEFTLWNVENLWKSERDFFLWDKFCPRPIACDFSELKATKERLGDRGIIRSHPFSPGQGSPWQSFCFNYGTEEAIFLAMDESELLHEILKKIARRTIDATYLWASTPADMVETDGGAGSSTVISPAMFEEFCLPYDKMQNAAFREIGLKTVCHLCGGLMPLLEKVAESGADGLETMTPPAMGGDCNLREASKRVGDKLFFIGGFDQNAGFEKGNPQKVRELVFDCFEATKDHAGYIISPSDHFFFGSPENIQAFSDAVKECVY